MNVVEYEKKGHVASIRMNRQEVLNSFSTELRLEITSAMTKANEDEDVRVVVISGAGNGFSAGHDLRSGNGKYAMVSETIVNEYKPMLLAAARAPKI